MKRKILSVLVALSTLIFASCSFNQAGQQEEKNGSKSAYIKIDASNARNALPVVGNVADFDSFVLTGTTDTASLAINKTWATAGSEKAYAKMTADSIAVTVGKSYDFTLTATKGGAVLSGTLTKAIAAGQNSLSFTLSPSSYATDGKGNLSIELSVPDAVQAVSAKLYKSDVEVTPEGAACTFANAKATYTANTIDSGNYVLVFTLWGDAAKTLKLGEWREYAGITKDLTSSSTPAIASNSELESIYTITLNYDGGSLSGTFSGSYTRYSDDITLPAGTQMTKFGHTFAGWKIGDEAVTTIAKGTVGNITVTATWTANANFVTSERLATMQQSITSAAAGGSVTLSPANGIAPQGSTLNISKALTVDGNGIDGLTINVSSSVQSNITLKNFKKAKLQVVAPAAPQTSTSVNRARAVSIHDTENEDGEKIEKFGDDALPLRLEGCEIKEFIIEDEVALYLGTGEEKTTIEELKLDLVEGAEKFTFIENDKDIDEEDRSSIEKLRIEDGLKEINLIGGSFDDVDFADDFSFEDDKLKFNYDPEFEQFKDDDFLRDEEFKEKAEAWDIALAKYEIDENTNGSGVYKFEMTPADFLKLNGYIGVIFLNDEQATAATGNYNLEAFQRKATYETPMYNMSIMGAFRVKERTEGLQPVYGRNTSYLDYNEAYFGNNFRDYVRKTHLDNYQIYSKDAVVIDIGTDKVTLYVNMAGIKKQDVTINITPNYEDTTEAAAGIFEGGSKLTKVDLTGYKPYFIIDTGIQDANGMTMAGESSIEYAFLYDVDISNEIPDTYGPNAISFIDNCLSKPDPLQLFPKNRWIYLPISSDQKSDCGEPMYYPFAMTEVTGDYPDVSAVEAEEWSVNQEHITVDYYDPDLKFMYKDEMVIKENLNPLDAWEYYYDDKFEYKIPCDPMAFAGGLFWNFTYEGMPEKLTKVYARPKRFVSFLTKQIDPLTMKEKEEYELGDYNMGFINFPNIESKPVIFFKTYDPETKELSDKITKPTEVNDYDIVYLVDAYVNLVIANPNKATDLKEIGTLKVASLPVTGEGGEYNPNGNVGETYFYETAEMTAGSQYTPATKSNLNESLGTKLYFNLPVKILTSDNMSVKSSLTYFDFKAKLDKGEKFYTSTQASPAFTDPVTGEEHPAQTEDDITWTAAKLEKYVTEDLLNGMIQPIRAYDELLNNTSVTVHDSLDGNDQSMEISVSSVLAEFDTGMATFYSDADMKTLLTRAQISELTANTNIYRKYKTFKMYMINTDGTVYDTPDNRSINDVINQGIIDPNTHIYADAACTTEYTSGTQIKALADGTELYWKFVSQSNPSDPENQGDPQNL